MFWDGSRWVDTRPAVSAAHPRPHRRRLRDWLATLPIVLLVPALILPTLAASAATASLTVSGSATPGSQIYVTGQGFPQRQWVQLLWDGGAMVTVRTSSASTFSTTVTIPTTAQTGMHTLSAMEQRNGKKSSASLAAGTTMLASVTVSVTSSSPVATPTPTPAATPVPTPGATPTPTPAATPVPTPVATPTPTPVATSTPTPSATPVPTPVATPSPTPVATPSPTPSPTPSADSVRVTSIPALLTALANDSISDIVVANGTYRISTAASQRTDSLWIGSRFAGRTNPVVVRAETTGGVRFDGGGASYFGGLTFVEGAHDQTWDGFVFINGSPTHTGVITFGGYVGKAAPHHITLRNITLDDSLYTASTGATDHGIYFSQAVDGVHDILIDGLYVDGGGGLDSAVHLYHSSSGNPNAWNVTVRRMTVVGTSQAIIVWDSTVRNIVFEDSTITGATQSAVRYERGGTLTLRRVTSTGSGQTGFYSSLGSSPSGVTFVSTSLR